jgi:hypothetical protein
MGGRMLNLVGMDLYQKKLKACQEIRKKLILTASEEIECDRLYRIDCRIIEDYGLGVQYTVILSMCDLIDDIKNNERNKI